MTVNEIKDEISIVICGEAGQGIQTVETLLIEALKSAGFYIFCTKEYMSRVRGGANSIQIRVSEKPVSAYIKRTDILIPLIKEAVDHLGERISKETFIIQEDFTEEAKKIGDVVYSNVIAASTLAALFGINRETFYNLIEKKFSKKGEEVVQKNKEAADKGFEIGKKLSLEIEIKIEPKADKNDTLINGAQAVAMGTLAGGCNFIAAYPMTPSTGVFTYLASQEHEFGIVVEQAEDEISAMNMNLGAWYAGARGLVSTAGGGFDLMTEGLSLAGITETPIVIHLGQRPGPATGLPTRTEQGDLNIALYAGHGEFPRIILTPGNLEDAFYLTQKAFNLADKYQVPVFVLTDQFLVDSYYNIKPFDLSNVQNQHFIKETGVDYKRYQMTENGISPRGIPQFGEGLVCVDSDEHDESGHITESQAVRTSMNNKRLSKIDMIKSEIFPPELIGSYDYKTLLIGWGSTYLIIKEAIEKLGRNDLGFLYFKQVYPLHDSIVDYIKKAEKTIIIENNATAQFGKLIAKETGIVIKDAILKYDGLPFSVEEIMQRVSNG